MEEDDRGEKGRRGVTMTHADRFCSVLIGQHSCQSEGLRVSQCWKSRL